MSIVATASVSDFFEEVLDDAMKARRVTVSDGARSYVVALLAELAKPGSPIERTLDRPLTLLLDEALHTPELAERFEKHLMELVRQLLQESGGPGWAVHPTRRSGPVGRRGLEGYRRRAALRQVVRAA